MAIHKTAGTKVYMSPTVQNSNTINGLSDAAAIALFTAISDWIEIGEVENVGELGDTAQPINFTAVGNRRARKLKGARDAGMHNIVCGRDPLDVGQIAMITAAATDYNFAFRITLSDIPPGVTTTSKQYYAGLVMSDPTQHGDVNSVTRRTFNVGINTGVYEIPAS